MNTFTLPGTICPRLEVRQVGGVFRVVARTASVLHLEHGIEPNPEPIREYAHKRTFADNGEAWWLAMRVEQALWADRSLNLRHWDVFEPGELVADSLLPAGVQRRLRGESL